MKNIKLPYFIIIVAVLALPVVLIVSQAWGNPLEDILAGIFVYVFYGLLIVSYLLRFGMIFLGVFALYRGLQNRINHQLAS